MADPLIQDIAGMYAYAMRKRFPYLGVFGKTEGTFANHLGAHNMVYGATVFDQVNRSTNGWAIFGKLNWDRTGYRLDVSNPTVKGFGASDASNTVVSASDYVHVTVSETDLIRPGFIYTPFNTTMEAAFRTRKDDGVDLIDYKRIRNREVHAQMLNEEWLRDATALYTGVATGGADTPTSLGSPTGLARDVLPSGVSVGAAPGMESLDRIISSFSELGPNQGIVAAADSGWGDVNAQTQSGTDASAAGSGTLAINRDTANQFTDSVVLRGDGSATGFTASSSGNMPFQIDALDALIDQTEINGAHPTDQIIFTGYKTRRKIYNEFRNMGRFDETEKVQAKYTMDGLNVTGTHDGRDITFTVRSYQTRPIVADRNVAGGAGFANGGESPVAGEGAARLYLADQSAIKIQVGIPTLYFDVDNPLIRGRFDSVAMYLTAAQGRPTRLNTSGKLRNISA